MAVLKMNVFPSAGQVGVNPYFIFLETDNTYDEVTTTGFLNSAKNFGYTFSSDQTALVATTDIGNVLLNIEVDGNDVSLLTSKEPVNLNNGVIGNLPIANLNGGTGASSSTYWRGDGTWAAPTLSGTDLIYVADTIPAADLASGGAVTFLEAASPTATYALITVYTNASLCVDFTGGSGNRGAVLTDGTNNFVYLNSSTMNDMEVGSGDNSLITTTNSLGIFPLNVSAISMPGEDIVVKYYGGTTDWTDGTLALVGYFLQITA